jgi:TolA-binding protein
LSVGRWAFPVFLLIVLHSTSALSAATPEERRAFDAALKAFQDGVLGYERAEREFDEFIKAYPMSERRNEAVLRQAQSRYYMTNAAGAASLLSTNLAQAGKLADEYQFWLGEALFLGGRFAPAAEAYAKLATGFPSSPHLLAASYNEALCRSKLGEPRKVVELLQRATGAFQRAARSRPRDEWVARGGLLLAETHLDLRDFKAGEAALNFPASVQLAPDLAWRRQYLLCRLQSADNRDEAALAGTTALLSLATAAKNPRYSAESVSMRAGQLAKLKRHDEAVAAYSINLSTNAPPEFRRQALLRNIELTFEQNKIADTIRMLEDFSAQQPNDPALDVAQVTLGELRLKEYFTLADASANAPPPPAATNLLLMALTNSARVINAYTNSPLLARAHYTRGWVLWNQGREGDSLGDFRVAAERLPHSEEQAIARFKLAEAQSVQKDFTNAAANFALVVAHFEDLPRVKESLFDLALYKLMRAAIAAGDLKSAEVAVAKILRWYPDSFFADRGKLLLGQAFNHDGKPAEARAHFEDVLRHLPNSPLAPAVQLAIARTFKQEFNWPAAAAKLDDWVTRFRTNAALPDVEYERAWLNHQAGNATNALALFTSFIARFPLHTNAPLAQVWVGNHHYNAGAYDLAEAGYQRVFQNTNWAGLPLAAEARLDAGRAAMMRRGYKDSTNYFLTILNDDRHPADLRQRAYFALGDVYSSGELDGIDRFGDAINAWAKITNALAPLALGRIGSAHFARAATSPDPQTHYQNATNALLKAMHWPGADATARGNAEVVLALALEKLKRPRDAVDRLLNVVYGTNLQDGESPDTAAMKAAGLEAGRILESLQSWAEAIKLYERLHGLFPPLRTQLELRIETARKMLKASGKP